LKARPPILVPGEAIAVRNAKNTLALIENGYVHFRPVQIGRDYGTQSEILSGVKEGDVVATILTDQIRDGVKVDPQLAKQQAKPQQEGGQSDEQAAEEGRYGNQTLADQGGAAQAAGGKKGGQSGKGGGAAKGNGGGQNNSARPNKQQ